MKRRVTTAMSCAAIGTLALGTAAFAVGFEWNAKPMLGANERPVRVVSNSEARAQFELEDGTIQYKIRMRKPLDGAFMAHIHAGPIDGAGGVVVWLFGDRALGQNNPTLNFDKGDVVALGEISAADLVGALAGKPLDDLITLLNNGGAYVNLHTRAYPGGELRAQVEIDD